MKSRIQPLTESGIHSRMWKPGIHRHGIRNPQRGNRNPRLSWITLHGAIVGRLYRTFLVVQHSKHFRCNGSYIPRIVSWTSFGFPFIEFRGTPALWKFGKVLHLSKTFLCAPCSRVTRNGLCCWTTPCLKALLPWNFRRDSFHTELEYLPH